MVTEFDTGPSPSILVANTDTAMSVDVEQDEEETSNSWLHIPRPHEEGRTIAE